MLQLVDNDVKRVIDPWRRMASSGIAKVVRKIHLMQRNDVVMLYMENISVIQLLVLFHLRSSIGSMPRRRARVSARATPA